MCCLKLQTFEMVQWLNVPNEPEDSHENIELHSDHECESTDSSESEDCELSESESFCHGSYSDFVSSSDGSETEQENDVGVTKDGNHCTSSIHNYNGKIDTDDEWDKTYDADIEDI